ncbi:MAG: hypothetical protein U1F15_16135 [Burkholderiales bacterium]
MPFVEIARRRNLPSPATTGGLTQIKAMTTGSKTMKRFVKPRLSSLRRALGALAVASIAAAGAGAAAAAAGVDESEMVSLGFKVLVAETKVQKDWVRSLPPGRIKPVQRTGRKFFIYPDASANRIFVGGPAEYDAYRKLHPEGKSAQDIANETNAYRAKQDASMRAATAHDLSDPFLGVTWADLGW